MDSDLRSRIVSALEEHLARASHDLDTWKLIERDARTEDLNGKARATGTEMVQHFEDEIRKLKDFIARYGRVSGPGAGRWDGS